MSFTTLYYYTVNVALPNKKEDRNNKQVVCNGDINGNETFKEEDQKLKCWIQKQILPQSFFTPKLFFSKVVDLFILKGTISDVKSSTKGIVEEPIYEVKQPN